MILSMKVESVELHPNADRLRVYQFTAPGVDGPLQIVANLDNVYEAGDSAAVALIGTVLEDGTEIKKAKLRGSLSFGMTLGPTTEAVGTDLTDTYKATTKEKVVDESQGVVEESIWVRYTSIHGYLKMRDEILACDEVIVTEKSHGSNARFGFRGDTFLVGTHTSKVVASRMASATWPKDHLIHNLLRWVEENDVEARVAKWHKTYPKATALVIYGELMGFKCSDLHYGWEGTGVRMFGEANLDGKWLNYDDSVRIIEELFPGRKPTLDLLVPVLYRGKPTQEILRELRDAPSELALETGTDQISEGIVIRANPEGYSEIAHDRLIAKWKGPLYEERKSLRSKNADELPVYLSAWDLIFDFITAERVRHVLGKAEASGIEVHMRSFHKLAEMLLDDIIKESEGEWPEDTESLDRGVLVRWTKRMAGDLMSEAIEARLS